MLFSHLYDTSLDSTKTETHTQHNKYQDTHSSYTMEITTEVKEGITAEFFHSI